jgi:phosphotransferase system HPr-like phosphotransfer protein
MQKFISSLAVFCMLISIFTPLSLSAAAGDTVALEITAPATTRVGEAIDITIRAVDKDKKTVTSYRGSVIFNTDNIGDIYPAPGKTVTFMPDDKGEKKFSKGLIFKKSGKQKIFVSDVSDDIMGEATIMVDAAATIITTSDQSVTIITPENGTRITGDMVMVSGKTRKNSKITLSLNGQDADTVVSDDTGIFTKNIT